MCTYSSVHLRRPYLQFTETLRQKRQTRLWSVKVRIAWELGKLWFNLAQTKHEDIADGWQKFSIFVVVEVVVVVVVVFFF